MQKSDWNGLFRSKLFTEEQTGAVKSFLQDKKCRAESFSDGEMIQCPKKAEKELGILLCGKAGIFTPDTQKEALLRYLLPGDPVGIAALFTDLPYLSCVRAKGKCRVLFFSQAAIEELLKSDSDFLHRYLGFLSDRIRFLNRKIGFLTAGSAERRLALYLVSFGKTQILLPDSISSLSDLLGIGRASLYRAFDKLEADGEIQKSGKTIVLTHPDKLPEKYE